MKGQGHSMTKYTKNTISGVCVCYISVKNCLVVTSSIYSFSAVFNIWVIVHRAGKMLEMNHQVLSHRRESELLKVMVRPVESACLLTCVIVHFSQHNSPGVYRAFLGLAWLQWHAGGEGCARSLSCNGPFTCDCTCFLGRSSLNWMVPCKNRLIAITTFFGQIHF